MTWHLTSQKDRHFKKATTIFLRLYKHNQIIYSPMDMWAYNEKNSYSIFEREPWKRKRKEKEKKEKKSRIALWQRVSSEWKLTEHSENPSFVHSYHSKGSIGSIVTFCYSLYSFFVERSRPLWKRVCPFSVERRRPLWKRVLSFSVERRRPLWKRVCPFSVERRRPLRKRVLYYLSGNSDVIVESSSGLLGDWM